jgi:glycosyltransferase involved in cell wall biosynthesis
MPFFSVIIPTYNRAHFMPKAIESVINQSFTDWELIIIDDGSKDSTEGVVAEYLKDSRIKYFFQHNQERCVARNNGINRSAGKYITFLDSDDYFLPNRLQLLYNSIIDKNEPIAFFYTGICFENNGSIEERKEVYNSYNNIFEFIINAIIHTQQACIHNSLLKKHQFDPRFTIGEDMELWLRIAQDCPPVLLDNQATYVALEHDDRSVNIKKTNSGVKQLQLLKHIFKKPHPGSLVTKMVKKRKLSDTYFGIARHYIYNKRPSLAIINLIFSILCKVFHEQTKHRIYLIVCLLIGKRTEYL